jgi:hypothetical protein
LVKQAVVVQHLLAQISHRELITLVVTVVMVTTGKAEELFTPLVAVVVVLLMELLVTLVVLADLVMPIIIMVVVQAAMHKHLQPTLAQVVAVEEYIVHLAPMVHQAL